MRQRQAFPDGEPLRDPHLVGQAQNTDVGSKIVGIGRGARYWILGIGVQVQHHIVFIGGKASEDLERARQQLTRLVAGIGQHHEPALIAQRPFGGRFVGRGLEDTRINAVRDIRRRHPVRLRDVAAVLAHGDRQIHRLQDLHHTRGQVTITQIGADRVVHHPRNAGCAPTARDKRIERVG
jgi:hypothetical protein